MELLERLYLRFEKINLFQIPSYSMEAQHWVRFCSLILTSLKISEFVRSYIQSSHPHRLGIERLCNLPDAFKDYFGQLFWLPLPYPFRRMYAALCYQVFQSQKTHAICQWSN